MAKSSKREPAAKARRARTTRSTAARRPIARQALPAAAQPPHTFASVVVDYDGVILHRHGASDRYLVRTSPARASQIQALALAGLRAPINRVMRAAIAGAEETPIVVQRVRRNGRTGSVWVRARPLTAGKLLVMFEEAAAGSPRSAAAAPNASRAVTRPAQRPLPRRDEALASQCERLQTVNAELTAYNEELLSRIAELEQADHQWRMHQAALRHVHRVLTAGELAAALAHELNQPLTAIANLAEAARRGLLQPKTGPREARRQLDAIAMQAQRAGRLIRELRTFVSRESLDRKPVDLNAVLRIAGDLIGAEAAQLGIRLHFDLADVPLFCMATELHIEQALVNVLQNAVDALRGSSKRPRWIRVTTAAEQTVNHITVVDSGSGFSAAALARAFEPFYTTKQKGLGLGLSLSRSAVEAHGGRLWAVNVAPHGAKLCITLPRI